MTNNTNPAPDPFDPAALRLSQSYADTAGVKKLVTTIPVRKPNPQDFVRVHPDPGYRLTPAAIIELKGERETYLVPPAVAQQLTGEFSVVTLYTTINRQGVPHLWPVKLPRADGRQLEWHRSAGEAAERAMERWIRVKSNTDLGAYEISEAVGALSEPEWPDISFPEILKVAFRDRVVDSVNHPLVQRLRGVV
jgi:hypothetical protein